MAINFLITEYDDGTCRIEPYHMHYHYADGLSCDNVERCDLLNVMSDITRICKNEYKMGASFRIRS